MAAIECDGDSANVTFPTKTVRVHCAWCGCFLHEKETGVNLPDVDESGICDPCALEQLPADLHGAWWGVRSKAGMAAVHDEPLRAGERVFQGVA